MLLTVQELAQRLQIKPSTLYAWAAQAKIPHVRLGRLIRFRREEIDLWVEAHRVERPATSPLPRRNTSLEGIDVLIARARREVYTPARGKPDQDRAGKEGKHGSV